MTASTNWESVCDLNVKKTWITIKHMPLNQSMIKKGIVYIFNHWHHSDEAVLYEGMRLNFVRSYVNGSAVTRNVKLPLMLHMGVQVVPLTDT